MDENSCGGQLGLKGGGGGLLPVDVRAVLLHEPVQLLVGDAGDLVLHIFAFHGGNSFQVVRPQFFTLFAVSIRSWAGYAPPAAWHRLQGSNLPLPVLETGALPT